MYLANLKTNLEEKGYMINVFADKESAAEYEVILINEELGY